MPITLNVSGEVQIVHFQDPLLPEDLSSLRLKLDQKILQGQNVFAFDLKSLDFVTTKFLAPINELMDFCLIRKASVHAICNSKSDWKKISSNTKHKIEKHLSLEEIVLENPTPTPHGDFQHTNADLEKLVAEYQKKSIEKNYDPKLLTHTLENYKTQPSKEHLKTLEAAVLEYKKLQEENLSLNRYVTELSDEVVKLTEMRKSAIHANEIELRKKELVILKKINEIEKELLRINYG